MYRNMLISVSCDWETVKNVVMGNSSSKLDRTGRDGKFAKQSKMLNNSAYSRLGNKCICLRHETVLLFSMSCDWETVKNVVPGNSSMKPDQTGGD